MRIGLTYDLRDDYLAEGFGEEETAEFDRPDTIEAIASSLRQLGHEPDRIGHLRHLVHRLAGGDRWDLVFNIAEGLYGFGREAVVPAVLEAYQIPYTFSDPMVSALTLHKGITKRVLRDFGLPTPDFQEVGSEEEIDAVRLPFPLFAKPIAEGTGKGVTAASKVTTAEELRTVCTRLLDMFRQPVIVETFLPGREFTVGIVGTGRRAESVGVAEIILQEGAEKAVYSYVNKERCELLVEYRPVADDLARKAEQLAIQAWRALGCRDAGRIDLRTDGNGLPLLLEVNPLAGLNPEHSDLPIICTNSGIPYIDLIQRIVESALERAREWKH